jgi:hypothetical protein
MVAQCAVDRRSNEIKTNLELLAIKSALVLIDAMDAQKAIPATDAAKEADDVLARRSGRSPRGREDLACGGDLAANCSFYTTAEASLGRVEERTIRAADRQRGYREVGPAPLCTRLRSRPA